MALPVELSYFDAASTDACTFGTDGSEVISCTSVSEVVVGDVLCKICATTSMMPDSDEHATVVTNVGVLGPSSKDIELEMSSSLTCMAH